LGDVSVVLCGEAGQGIQTVENILAPALSLAGYHVFSTKEYMSRIRGGSNSTEIRVSSGRVRAYVDRIDLLIPLDKDAIPHLGGRISEGTLIIGEKEKLQTDREVTEAPFTQIATDIGGPIFANTVAAGLVLAMLKVAPAVSEAYLREHFKAKDADIVEKNIAALRRGYELGGRISATGKLGRDMGPDQRAAGELLISGADAVGFGAVAGGCNFISAYPMTPSTGIFTFLARHAGRLGIVAEQAEDEISAINMALGAAYAGARAMVTTSGGGFALMAEGVSLAGMLELPLVISLGMRPAPATGLPTRTEQGDLEFALYSGHGEFPRAIYAPGTVEEAYDITRKAFDIAEKYQMPVFLLTDQYFVDSYYDIPSLDSAKGRVEKRFIRTEPGYRRYEVTGDGVSPRGLPGFGGGLVCVDSDEHDEWGHITEDAAMRAKMVEKRLRKLEGIREECISPKLTGGEGYTNLVVCWGSTYHTVAEAVESLGMGDVSVLHFSQVFPLHMDTLRYLKKAKRTVVVENNATGQFARLIMSQTGFDAGRRILKYDGLPFSVEGLALRLKEVLE
jgi:2-oxoglutarate/2-oxoacid ferredoxin oxidoreductase subunit alpha